MLDKQYQAKDHEAKIYKMWLDHDCFSPDSEISQNLNKKSKKANESFSIIMPPPNANDPLHVGHAMFVTLEDIMIRFARMQGKDTVWIPGTDHAGIETQFVFEKKLKKEGKSRFNFDRETLFKMIWDYVSENSAVAVDQIKQLGASADWSRYKFTLDKDIVETVTETFIKMNQDGLVYRANRLVNFCPKCGTAFSNLEVDHKEQDTSLYYIKYGPFTLATTRPETKFGDTGLAVHPDDKRYQKYIGQEIEVEGLNGNFKLKVIADDFVDPKFGTGVVKITPYHDFNDFAAWQRHKDELPEPIQIVDFEGRLTATAGKYAGLKIAIAREQVIKDLEEKGLLVKIDKNYHNNLSVCYRCGNPIEPLPLPQFYIKVKSLTNSVIKKIDQGEIKVFGAGHDKILRHWLETLEDWNISRQIVWGIRLPIWYEIDKNLDAQITFIDQEKNRVSGKLADLLKENSIEEIRAGLQNISARIEANYLISQENPGERYLQETDTFDTWFSSSQWPFVTLINNKPGDFERFYPTNTMETAYDILMFWVMRMLMMGIYKTGQTPFKNIYLHGLIRDAKGLKMSKSKGNVVNPMEISEKYGTDALRMALVIRSSAGLDKSVGDADFKAGRNLSNKLWNASRFILITREENQVNQPINCAHDQVFKEKLKQITKDVTKNLESFQLGVAADTLYNEFWHWFCDQCIEESKKGLINQDLMLDGLKTFLKLLHPFIPFVTEAIWQELAKENLVEDKILTSSAWPE
ncbi:MAG: Valine-tRNA ligase [Candidatus Pacebacteria bacterium GW2011_GWF2_38_9]|nr:MAG: valyl-tRNA synthetase, valyl-tRNA synthetase [candidate division TM6 bacterium GW2011_GWF2_28_16]KKQ07784.1 MAG: Valine-tRNA ligase [Candidatus Pacebacteria bacterium GW2011_GWF1_36_5]KKQ88396.1 MAG: Valine-tRNA ligase [Candidatus Pacebacteria bacterium GW2011_GWF2_38_9]HAZ73013.1 valine--tRNA ligase [Candidatus Paceibacterota bacterium]